MAESATEIKLFGKWSLDDVEINDISLVVSFEQIISLGTNFGVVGTLWHLRKLKWSDMGGK
jgi:hypothetical protein